ncbi:MAG: hypothetical protein LBE24_03450, partial [Methylobacillus sp.]|nr:hypothetical protein [Methylobacillus sp.]
MRDTKRSLCFTGQRRSCAPTKLTHCSNSTFPPFHIAARGLAMLIGATLLGVNPAQAQYVVPDGSPFSAAVIPAAIADGSSITLGGDATLDIVVTLPTGASGLTLNAAAGGSTVTVNPNFRFSDTTAAPVILNINGNVTFTGTGAASAGNGGVISSTGGLTTINANGDLTLNHNIVGGGGAGGGGAIYVNDGLDLAANNLFITNNNTQSGQGGGINANAGSVSLAAAGGNTTFTGNIANNLGGGIYTRDGDVTIGSAINNPNGIITFTNNFAGFTLNDPNYAGDIDVTQVTANGIASSNGGAIYSRKLVGSSTITLYGSQITLSNNMARQDGGGINTSAANIFGNLIAENNTAITGAGGAIYGTSDIIIGNSNTTSVMLNNNTAGGSTGFFGGGAIYAGSRVSITAQTITLNNNTAGSSNGGAIMGRDGISINGALTANNNSAGNGGALWTQTSLAPITLTGSASINNNSAGGNGGALWVGGSLNLTATIGNMAFRGNTDSSGANAIWLENSGGNTITTFNADTGRNIIFYDPIRNNVTTGLLAVSKVGAGSLVFDGTDYLASQPERWSQIYGNTTVRAGTFEVRNNAIYGVLAGDVSGTAGDSSFTVNSNATLAGGGDLAANRIGTVRADTFTLNGDLNIAGSAAPGTAAGGFSTFNVVSSNVNFGTGSQIHFNTYLNNASVQRSDILVLDLAGTATTGTANIIVTNVGGPGAITTGNGILLVETTGGATTTATAFSLPGGYVAAGPYQYEL